MTWLAVMVVARSPSFASNLTIPSTRTRSPVVMALAEVELFPFRYVVKDAVSTVTL
jgi:hypothetical protein